MNKTSSEDAEQSGEAEKQATHKEQKLASCRAHCIPLGQHGLERERIKMKKAQINGFNVICVTFKGQSEALGEVYMQMQYLKELTEVDENMLIYCGFICHGPPGKYKQLAGQDW